MEQTLFNKVLHKGRHLEGIAKNFNPLLHITIPHYLKISSYEVRPICLWLISIF